jgi:peroxiredoxin
VEEPDVNDYQQLPSNLPVPQDNGAADQLPGAAMPALVLRDTGGNEVALDQFGPGRTVIYLYPLSGRPGVDLPDGWDAIHGARGCTPEACGFRDHHADLQAAGTRAVYGLSSQSTDYQTELADRLGLPLPILSDPELALAEALELPTFEADEERLFSRLTMIVTDGRIEYIFYPIFPPDQHAAEVLEWLRGHAAEGRRA